MAGTNGGQVPLSAVAHYSNNVQPLTVNHQGVFSVGDAVVQSCARRGVEPGGRRNHRAAARNSCAGHAAGRVPGNGAGFPVFAEFDAAVGRSPPFSSIYVVLGMLYESFIHPITILSSLPSAGVGALLMLMLFGYDLSLIAFIGIILLIGIVKKNAIMMIDFALEAERHEGKIARWRRSIRPACCAFGRS